MPISFVLAIIFAVAGLIVIALAAIGYEGGEHEVEIKSRYDGRIRTEPRNDPPKWIVIAGLAMAFGTLSGLMVFSASATQIPTRTIGVETHFGKPVGTVDNGFHMVAPWNHVERFTTQVQFLTLSDNDSILVRLGNQTTANIDVNRAQWNIDPDNREAVLDLYRRYKDFDKIRDTVVIGAVQAALREKFQSFDPLAGISRTGVTDAPTGPTVDQITNQALVYAQKLLGDGITLSSLPLFVHYDGTTQTKLNDYAASSAGTRIATQNAATAAQIALGNKALAEQASTNSPGVQYQNCLSMIERLAARNQLGQLPLAFTCVPPGSGSTQNPILIQPKK